MTNGEEVVLGQRQHPLPPRHVRDGIVDQLRRCLRRSKWRADAAASLVTPAALGRRMGTGDPGGRNAMQHGNLLSAWAAAALLLAGHGALAAPDPARDEAALASLQGVYGRSVPPGEAADRYRELLPTVLQRIRRSSVAEVDLAALAAEATKAIEALPPGTGEPAAVFRKAVHAAMQPIDPHFRYFDPQAYGKPRFDRQLRRPRPRGRGRGGAVRVVAPIPGSPAARAGLAPGDLIVRVDDQPLSGLPLADAIARMRGQPGTPVSLTIQRAGTAGELTVSLTRDTIRRQVLRWSMEGDVLVLRIAAFGDAVAASLEQAVARRPRSDRRERWCSTCAATRADCCARR